MNIDRRLSDASAEVRSELATLSPPEPSGRPSWWRGVAIAAGAAAIVIGVIGVATVLRDDPTSSDVAETPIPTTDPVATTEPIITDRLTSVDLPIENVEPDVAAAKLAAFDGFELFYSDASAVGRVGDGIVFVATDTEGRACLLWLEAEEFSHCAETLELLGLGASASFNSQVPALDYQLLGMAPTGADAVLVTAGEDSYVQEPRDGFIAIVLRRPSPEPIKVEVLAADGSVLLDFAPLDPLALAEEAVLQVGARAESLQAAVDPDVEELVALEQQLRSLVAFLDANTARPAVEDLVDTTWDRLIALRAELVPEGSEEYPQFIPVAPEVTAAIEGNGAMSISPDGIVWITGGSRFGDNPSEPHFLNAIDAGTGELIARYEVGLSMYELAAGSERVWFGRTADGGVQITSIGYLDLGSGELVIENIDHNVHSIFLADDGGHSAFVLSQDPVFALSRLGPSAVPTPIEIDLGGASLSRGIAWEGGLLVAGSGTVWRVDPVAETAEVFAELGDRAVASIGAAAAPGGESGVWLTTWTQDEVRAVLLDSGGDIVADHLLLDDFGPFGGKRVSALSTDPVDQSAYALMSNGEVWFVAPSGEPTLLFTVPPGSGDTGFADLERLGTSLWLHGSVDGLVQVQLGQ